MPRAQRFRPKCYLTDEWGCPNMEPVIGIPFYLADPKLQRLESEMNDIEDARQIMMYLRHEAGHAFNYAYALYKTKNGADLRAVPAALPRQLQTGSVLAPVRAAHGRLVRAKASRRRLCRDLRGLAHASLQLAQAVQGWGAMKKLLYMDRIGRKFGDADPVVASGDTDITVDEMEVTVGEFYQRAIDQQLTPGELPLDTDLHDIFNVSKRRRKNVRAAVDLLRENRKVLVDKVNYWTGVQSSAGQEVGGNHRSKSWRPGSARRHKM
jgi:hypothetical protein